MPRNLPSGMVTFLFTDVEGSTKLLRELGPAAYADALSEHRRVLREAFGAHGGVEVDTQGDAFFIAFPTAPAAVRAAAAALEALATGAIRVRMGIHTGTAHLVEEGYVGADVHKGARIAAAGHGGQVLLSKETRELADADMTDLGEHRLKDFAEPIWIFQLGSERFPPLKTISNTNLPRPAGSFVGRAKELEEVTALLATGARLLTLTGPGGSGKTRLALETAAELVPEFRNGVFWIGLAPVRDSALVLETIAQTLGVKDGLAEHVGQREMLLLLDNLEQVVESAPELAWLVEVCPNLRLLVTSRELLRVRGEVEYPVLPLLEPEAVDLFCARSRLEPDEAVAELCRRLDSLPLAVELAAARTSVLSPRQILDRLSGRLDLLKGGRDADPRQQTLRATIQWSYELLAAEEQKLFARLSVFRGGCTLGAAEDVGEAELDTLQSLVDKSLLRHTDERFWMLETIREFAAEGLEESGEAEGVRRRHAEHLLALAEEAEPHLLSRSAQESLDRLEREHDNLRAALDLLQSSGESQLVLRLAGAVSEFWDMRGHHREGRSRLESALDADERPTAARGKALNGASLLAGKTGDIAAAKARAQEALALYRMLGDSWGTANALWVLGYAHVEEGDPANAQQLLQESVQLFRELGHEHFTLLATRTLAWTYQERGDLDHARALHEDNLARARALHDEYAEAATLNSLAGIALDQSRVEESIPLLKQSLALGRDIGDVLETGGAGICGAARALALMGRGETATRLIAVYEAFCDEMAASIPWITRKNEETLATIRAQLDEAAFAEAWKDGRRLTVDEAVALALVSLDRARAAPASS